MRFFIQAGNPQPLRKVVPFSCGEEFHEILVGMIQSCFSLETEALMMYWDSDCRLGPIQFGYRYEMDQIISDMAQIIARLRASPSGAFEWCFGLQGYMPIWRFSWKDGILDLSWKNYKRSPPDVRMEGRAPVKLRLRQFIAEWKRPMEMCLRAFLACGFNSIHPETIFQFEQLIGSIPGNGFLYDLEKSPHGYIEIDVIYGSILRIRSDDGTFKTKDAAHYTIVHLVRGALTINKEAPDYNFCPAMPFLTCEWRLLLSRNNDFCLTIIERNTAAGTEEVFTFETTLEVFSKELLEMLEYLKATSNMNLLPDAEYEALKGALNC